MGNLIPGGRTAVNVWEFTRSDGLPDVTRIKAYYNGDVVQQVRIGGPTSLSVTLEVDNANIQVRGDDHRICIIGRNNTLTILGSRATLRIEGGEEGVNQLKGDGVGTTVYTDSEVNVEVLVIAARNPLTKADGEVVDEAPQKLDLWDCPLDRPTTWERPALIRCTYAPVPRGGGGGGGDGDNQSASNSNVVASKDDPNQNDMDGQNGPEASPSPSGSDDNLSGKRQNNDGGDPDPSDESQSKKAKAE